MLFMFWVILLLHVVAAEVTLQIPAQGSANSSIIVHWSRKGDDSKFWDLRICDQAKGRDLDMGLVAATVRVKDGAKDGNVSIIFPKTGRFALKAVRGNPSQLIASSRDIVIDNLNAMTPTNTSEPSATPSTPPSDMSSPSSTASPTAGADSNDPSAVTTASAASSKSSSRTPIIVGVVIGVFVLLSLIGLFIIWFIRRRRRHQREAARRLTFHRDLMVQRRDTLPIPIPTSNYDLEAALAVAQHPSADPFARPASSASWSSTQTTRQLDIELRITKLQAQILELGNQPAYTSVVEKMRRQVEWLHGQEGSDWALGLTDERPRNYDLYMTH